MPYGDGILESPADRYGKTTLCMRNAKRLFKCAAYMVYFVGVLVFAVASKGSFLLMTQSLGNRLQEKQYASRWSFMLVATICVPYVFLFLEALAKSLFRNRRGPVFTDLITIFVLESIHTFGVCLLVFRVLPSCDVIRGLLLMNAVCTIPAFCKLTLSKSNSRPMLRFLTLFIDLAAFAAQCSVYFVVTSTQYTAFLTKPSTTTTTQATIIGDSLSSDTFDSLNTALSNSIKTTTDAIEQVQIRFGWEAPVALFCVSIVWWENYVDRDIKLGKLNIPLGTYKRHLQSVRSKANIGASIWKIALTVAFSFLLLPKERFENVFVSFNSNPTNNILNEPSLHTGSDLNNYDAGSLSNQFDMGNNNNDLPVRHKRQMPLFPTDDNNTIMGKIGGNADQMSLFPGNDDDPNIAADPFDFQPDREKTIDDYWHSIGPFVPMIIHFFSTGLCYYFSKSACKMQMQRMAFAVPLTLATPVTLAIMIGLCQWKTDQIVFIREIMYWECSENLNTTRITWHIIIGLCLWYLSQLWITSHIWFPENKRLATTETLFVLPQYDSSLIEQSLLLNRRRNEPEHQKNKLEEHFEDLDIIDGMAAFSEDEKLENNTKIYLCGTLWHETISEMILMLKSIMRMDIDQSARRQARDEFQVIDPDYYDMEAHVFFDDAFYHDENQQRTLNMFVKDFFEAINKAAGIVHDVEGMKLAPPQKTATPYGGRLSWRLPGGNLLVVHLKDKLKVSKKKRWSMVMYMYYLLGYRILGQCEQRMKSLIKLIEDSPDKRNYRRHFDQNEDLHVYYKDILGPRLLLEAENTFILSVDGDVDFGPDSVRMLIDRMKKDKKVGAVSSRIHPIGSGPLIWYQKMEYAMCYWLQKTTEHSLGCVLCAPGCFALYRASALMDDNVMKVFAARCESPEDYLLQDLGEDRFLSKLLIEQGYRIEYCAAADAYTHAPETFTDFFNQRRRWIPSTLGITVSILKNYRRTIRINESVSFLAILYHVFYLALYILSPATITIAIADAFNATTDIDVWAAYTLACFPAIAFLMICYHDITEEKKIICAAIFGTYYAIVMMIVVVGTIPLPGIISGIDNSQAQTNLLSNRQTLPPFRLPTASSSSSSSATNRKSSRNTSSISRSHMITSRSTTQSIQSALADNSSNIKKPIADGTIRYVNSRHGFEVQRYSSANWLSTDIYTKDACQAHEKTFRQMLDKKRQIERLSRSIYSSDYYSKRWHELLQSYKQGYLTHAEWAKQNYQLYCLKTLYTQAKRREQKDMDLDKQELLRARAKSAFDEWKETKCEEPSTNRNRLTTARSHQTLEGTSVNANNSFSTGISKTTDENHTTSVDTNRRISISTSGDCELQKISIYQPIISSKNTSTISSSIGSYILDQERWSLQAMLKRVVGLAEPLSQSPKVADRKQSPVTITSIDSGFESVT
ncbi:unnamed protein product [Rotaria sp. Silwood2]|nr:unnamed protein product [Rotaria sp. Silwood2]